MKAHRIRITKPKLHIPVLVHGMSVQACIAEFDRLNALKPITYVAKEKSK